jgi:glycosyltransferase involved in cell wall biosynthesis
MKKIRKAQSIAIFLPNLAGGGAERVNILLASQFIKADVKVTFVLQSRTGELIEKIPQGAHVISFDRPRTLACVKPLVRFLEREQPDILLSNMGHNNIVSVWATKLARSPTRVIAVQHSAISFETRHTKNWQHKMLPLLYRLFLPWAHGIVAVSHGVADDLTATTGLPRNRITAIHNPVITPDFEALAAAKADHEWLTDNGPPYILSVGRLTQQKDHATLIRAFAEISSETPARLLILGAGEKRMELDNLVRQLGLSDRVCFAGFQENPVPFMRKAAALVLSSQYEGFGNVIVEALACGTPIVSTDCPYGPKEILESGYYGRLVPVSDSHALGRAIFDTLNEPPRTELLKARGLTFTVDRAFYHYMRLIENTLNSSPSQGAGFCFLSLVNQ